MSAPTSQAWVVPLLRFRRALESEAETLSAIAIQSKALWPYSAEQLRAWHGDLIVSSDLIATCPTEVVELDGAIVGFCLLIPGPGHWTLEHFWLQQQAMGRGIGRALLQHAMEIAAMAGATAMHIDADPHVELFYKACGAVSIGAVTAPIDGFPDRSRPQMLLTIQRED